MKKLFILLVAAALLMAGSAFAATPSPPNSLFGMDYGMMMQQAMLASIATIPTIETMPATASPPIQATPANIYFDCTNGSAITSLSQVDLEQTMATIRPTHRFAKNDDFVLAIWTSIGSPPQPQALTANFDFNNVQNPFTHNAATAMTRNGPLKVSERGAGAMVATANQQTTTLDFNDILVAEKTEAPRLD